MKILIVSYIIILLIACSEPPSELYHRWYMIQLLDENGKIQNLEKCRHYMEFFENGTYDSGGYVKDSGIWNFDANKKSITFDDTLKSEILMLNQDTLKYTIRRGNKSMTSINVTAEHCKDLNKE